MQKLVLSALALGAMTSAALAEPVAMTDTQMDGVTAAGRGGNFAHQVAVAKVWQSNSCNFCLGVGGGSGNGNDGIQQENEAEVEIEQEIEQD